MPVNKTYTLVFLFVVLTGYSSMSLAWNQLGHRVVAAIAYDHLTVASKRQVDEWLSHHPDYDRWVQGVPAAERGEVAFLEAAGWPDEIKSTQGYENDGEKSTDATSGQNIGFADRRMHKYWHYVDFGFSQDSTPTEPPQRVNALTQIALLHQTLSDPHAAIALKSYDLSWLIHLVGDIHQPMHAVSRFSQDAKDGDAGGNRVKLCESPCRNNLHSLWDDALGHGKKEEAALRAADRLENRMVESAGPIDPNAWAAESFKIAKEVAYNPAEIGQSAHEIAHPSESYRQKVHEVARERAALAGLRLANMINAEVKASQR